MSCCGSSYSPHLNGDLHRGAGVTGSPPAIELPRWRVTYPNGAVLEFEHEWQAAQAAAISGGLVERLDPPTRPGEPDTPASANEHGATSTG